MRLLFAISFILAIPVFASAQFQYFGPGNYGSIKTTSKWGIPYDDGNFQAATSKRIARGIKRLGNMGAPQGAIGSYLSYPQTDIAALIDEAYDHALAAFTGCGGALADKALAVDPARYFVLVEPTIWQTTSSPTGWAAGETIPSTRLIRVVNYYFSESMRQLQWLPNLIVWEQLNHMATETGITGESGSSPRWPCDAAPH